MKEMTKIPMTKVLVIDDDMDVSKGGELYSSYTKAHPDNAHHFIDLYILNMGELDFEKYDPLYILTMDQFITIQGIPTPLEGFGETLYHETWNEIKEYSIRVITERSNELAQKSEKEDYIEIREE